eukprot:2137127-Prymnesium_polylepis.1
MWGSYRWTRPRRETPLVSGDVAAAPTAWGFKHGSRTRACERVRICRPVWVSMWMSASRSILFAGRFSVSRPREAGGV